MIRVKWLPLQHLQHYLRPENCFAVIDNVVKKALDPSPMTHHDKCLQVAFDRKCRGFYVMKVASWSALNRVTAQNNRFRPRGR